MNKNLKKGLEIIAGSIMGVSFWAGGILLAANNFTWDKFEKPIDTEKHTEFTLSSYNYRLYQRIFKKDEINRKCKEEALTKTILHFPEHTLKDQDITDYFNYLLYTDNGISIETKESTNKIGVHICTTDIKIKKQNFK